MRCVACSGEAAVFRATDLATGDDVAIKLVPVSGDRDAHRVRRELAALRSLPVPGVVALRDDGRAPGHVFLVMDVVRGAPFPGVPTPAPWAAVERPARRLAEIVAEVHRAGIVHRDLKPGNVLVEGGEPVVLDFGVARGASLAPVPAGTRGELTPRYAAPEQYGSRPVDARSDLYAVGRMLEEAVAAPRPPWVDAMIAALLEVDPARRPPRADAVLAGWDGFTPRSVVAPVLARIGDPVTAAEDLRAAIVGPEPFLHLPRDA